MPAVPAARSAGYCEVLQTSGDALDACLHDIDDDPVTPGGDPVAGWCYIDAALWPEIGGNPQLVAHCPAGGQRTLRFVGEARPPSGAQAFLACEE